LLACFCFVSSASCPHFAWAVERVDFNRDVRPILAKHCVACHGPDEAAREAELRLDIDDELLGPFALRDSGKAIVAGNPAESLLWKRINSEDEDLVMPPLGDEHPRLEATEKEVLKEWIIQGGQFARHWAFTMDKPSAIPQRVGNLWQANAVDAFALDSLATINQKPSNPASKRTLIRRLTLDLAGLPPSREEIAEYLSDESEDAYTALVDRLLASPAYGEHMARYWLDLVRFADTNGIHHDHYREMTPYRDWVIRSFNSNLPFDDFVTYQIAGDLLPSPTRDQLIASGFNRLHLVIDRGTAIPQESFTRNVIDRVNAFGTAFLGLTVGCAVCHDHKYDPFTMKDFYSFAAFFADIEEVGHYSTKDQPPSLEIKPADPDSGMPVRKTLITVSVEPREMRILPRGNWLDRTGDVVTPAPLESVVPEMKPAVGKDRLTRLDLANWMMAPENLARDLTIGTAEGVTERLKRYEDLGYDEYSFWIDSGMSFERKRASLARFIDDVMPAFQ